VIDDALQGVTDVVRGEDLFWSTSVHRLLQNLLGLPQPSTGITVSSAMTRPETVQVDQATGLRELRAAGRHAGDIRRLVGCRSFSGQRHNPAVTPAAWPAMLFRREGESWRQNRGHAQGTAAKKRPRRSAHRRVARRSARKRQERRPRPGMVEAALAAFAHEVRTPLTGILAISNLLATSDLDERERRWVDTIKAGAEHLASLATLFVDAARSRGPAMEGRHDLFDLARARPQRRRFAGRDGQRPRGLQVTVEVSDKLPGLVIGDSVRLRAALENLIDNAVKFTEQGAVALAGDAGARRQRQGRDSPLPCPTAASGSR
jgi:signal transduction histidine kinase